MKIHQALPADLNALLPLVLALWPSHTAEEMAHELQGQLTQEDTLFLLAYNDTPCGFAQCSLRHDYVEGTHSSPVGYLEGIYVTPEARQRGVARALVERCEDWARTRGCAEFASDCELPNTQSLAFHLSIGFQEANRIICFAKTL
ncbi:MAG: GNAT family N-acetyltransferase [Clostridium sp. SCN 57-10]|nr:MAG: GNAT family N-acetyltransferase [Clostridium sp. SCN 57-10]